MSDKYYVYMLICSDDTFYTGITNNLEKRLKSHNEGKASKYTRVRLPVQFVYVEEIDGKGPALSREFEIKSLKKNQKIKLIESTTNLTLSNYWWCPIS